MAEIIIHAATGRTTGTRASGRLRASGHVPATVYGLGAEAKSVSVEWRELRAALTTDAALNVLVDLEVDGSTDLVMVKDLQRHPVRRDVLHVDFLRVSRDVAISVDVPIHLHGEAELVTRDGGVVDQAMHALTVTAKPADIPNEIVIDVTRLQLGGAIRVGDIKLPSGVVTEVDPEEPVVVASAGESMAEIEALDAEIAEAQAEEAADEAAEGEGDAEGGDGDSSGDGEG